jgi:DNA-directed RNA polymerase sigma subunit (sigma70/sigma32)|tara:strand:- start:633 stop:791 length:159 start_codon:yes stop_codon:yes gene_type:complete
MEYEEDLNCCLVAVEKNGNMTLNEVGKRLKISYVRVKQIETEAINKLQKKVI